MTGRRSRSEFLTTLLCVVRGPEDEAPLHPVAGHEQHRLGQHLREHERHAVPGEGVEPHDVRRQECDGQHRVAGELTRHPSASAGAEDHATVDGEVDGRAHDPRRDDRGHQRAGQRGEREQHDGVDRERDERRAREQQERQHDAQRVRDRTEVARRIPVEVYGLDGHLARGDARAPTAQQHVLLVREALAGLVAHPLDDACGDAAQPRLRVAQAPPGRKPEDAARDGVARARAHRHATPERPAAEHQRRSAAGGVGAQFVGDAQDVGDGVLSVGVGGDDIVAGVLPQHVGEPGAQRPRLAAVDVVVQYGRAEPRRHREHGGVVRSAAVVDHDHLDIRVGAEQSGDDARQPRAGLVRGDQDDHGVTPPTDRRCTGCRSWRARRRSTAG